MKKELSQVSLLKVLRVQLALALILMALFYASNTRAESHVTYLEKNSAGQWAVNVEAAKEYVSERVEYCDSLDSWWSEFKKNRGIDELDSFKCKYNFRISIYSKQAETFRWLSDWSYVDYGLNLESTKKLSREYAKISKDYKLKKDSLERLKLNNRYYKGGVDKSSLTIEFLNHLNDRAHLMNMPRWSDK